MQSFRGTKAGGTGEGVVVKWVTCFLQDFSTFWDRIFAALFLAAKYPYIIRFLLKEKNIKQNTQKNLQPKSLQTKQNNPQAQNITTTSDKKSPLHL